MSTQKNVMAAVFHVLGYTEFFIGCCIVGRRPVDAC
jgi:hypothetical protein